MNLLGHPCVVWKIFKPFTWYHIVGSSLPDLVPFVTTTFFSFEEFHEGGEKFYRFLRENKPDAIGLAEGMLAHGVRYGADQYSRKLEEKYQSFREEISNRILTATPNLNYEMAYKARFHNFLWWGIDVQILNHENDFMAELREVATQVDIQEVVGLISSCFSKDRGTVMELLSRLEPIFRSRYANVEDLARLWKWIAKGLPEGDDVDMDKTRELFEYIAGLEKNEWKQTLDEVVDGVRSNLSKEGYIG